jgi:pullulanase/glycogen debranching enzyme
MAHSPWRQRVREEPFPAATTGHSIPIGATLVAGGANFSVFSWNAASIELLFFDRVDDARPSRVMPIDPLSNRTYHWSPFSHSIAIGGELKSEGILAYIILNTYWEPLDFELPMLGNGRKKW